LLALLNNVEPGKAFNQRFGAELPDQKAREWEINSFIALDASRTRL
jgi:hypothetical protein